MGWIIYAVIDIAKAMIFLLPIMLLLNKFVFHNTRHLFLYLIFAAYLAAVWSLVGLPNIMYIRPCFSHNFIPFAGSGENITGMVLNVALFTPLGYFLPIFWNKFRKLKNTLCFALCTTIAIELLQCFTLRATDINDIIANTVGAMIGHAIAKGISKGFTRFCSDNDATRELYVVLAMVFAVMFFFRLLLFAPY